jgi:hypothetical protein
MGVLKTLCMSLSMAALASTAEAEDTLLRHVTECVGRLSAQMEHHWLFQDKSSDQIERQRAHLVDILETLTTAQNAGTVLSDRIDAKMAHASLLTRAAFSDDPRTAQWAENRAFQQIRMCNDITLTPPKAEITGVFASSGPSTDKETMNQRAVHIRK